MLEKYYIKPQTIDHIRANWLAEPIERYVTWLHDRGYATRTVFHRVPLLLHFGSYTQARGAKTWSDLPQHVPGFVDDWVRDHGGNFRTERARKSVANTVRKRNTRLVGTCELGNDRPLRRDQSPHEAGRLAGMSTTGFRFFGGVLPKAHMAARTGPDEMAEISVDNM